MNKYSQPRPKVVFSDVSYRRAVRKSTSLPDDVIPPFPDEGQRKLLYAIACSERERYQNSIQLYLPAVQLKFIERLTPSQRTALWERVSMYVRGCERHHYKKFFQMPNVSDHHTDRVLAFYEYAEKVWHKKPTYIAKTYKAAFSEIETLLQFRRWGIALPTTSILEHRRWYIRHAILYLEFCKTDMNFAEFYYRKYKKHLTEKSANTYNIRNARLRQILKSVPRDWINGIPTPLSYEDNFLETEDTAGEDIYGASLDEGQNW